jgi:predicted Zn-dependent protease
MRRRWLLWVVLVLALAYLAGCAEVVQVGTAVGEGMGKISKEDKEALDRLAVQTAKAVRPMTEQEEYYVGRAVAATLLGQYRLYPNERMTSYINAIGQAAALASDRPITYGGYHFSILDTDEVNALSCPGGFVFITRGMLKRAKNEEELAAILAHEVAHVNHKDGLAAIQKSRWAEAVSILGSEAARKAGGRELTQLVSLFEGSVDDVVKTLLVRGYGREQESAADQSALTFLRRLGYSPYGLPDMLEILSREQASRAGQGIFATHPGMDQRLAQAKSTLSRNQWPRKDDPQRNRRFRDYAG